MNRKWLYGCGAAVALSAMLGCSTCCSPDLYNYPTYGGRYERVDREYGRVGSIFSDPNAPGGAAAPQSSGEPVRVVPDNSEPREQLELPAPRRDSAPSEAAPANPTPNSAGESSGNQARANRTRWR